MEEPQAVANATHSEEAVSAALDNDKYGDIIHIEKEDAQSETSGVMSVSDMESALGKLDDIECVRISEYHNIHKPNL